MGKVHKAVMSQEEQRLSIAVIGKITRRMESKAARVGYDIDTDTDWMLAHDIITDYDMGKPLSRGQAITIYDLLERVSARISYDFWRGFIFYLGQVEV